MRRRVARGAARGGQVPAVRVHQHQVLLLQQLQPVAAAALLQELPPVLDQGRRPAQRPRGRGLPQDEARVVVVVRHVVGAVYAHVGVGRRGGQQEPAPGLGVLAPLYQQRQREPHGRRRDNADAGPDHPRHAVVEQQRRRFHDEQPPPLEPLLHDRRGGATGADIRRSGGGAGVPLRATAAAAAPGVHLRGAAEAGGSAHHHLGAAAGGRAVCCGAVLLLGGLRGHGAVRVPGRGGDIRARRRRVSRRVLERRELLDGRRPGPQHVPTLARLV